MRRIVTKKTLGGAIGVLMILLVFFSRTLYSHNLPVVKAVLPENGRLSKKESASGTAQWAESENIYSKLVGTVVAVHALEGDKVTKGQELFTMEYDIKDVENKLLELGYNREKLNLDIKGLQLRIEKLERDIKAAEDEAYEQDEISNYELAQLLLDIRKAETDLDEAKRKYYSSPTSYTDVDNAQYKLASLLLKKDNLEKTMLDQQDKTQKESSDKEKERSKRIADYNSELSGLKLDISSKKLDIEVMDFQESGLKGDLEDFEAYQAITSPVDGVITSLSVAKGEKAADNKLLMSIGIEGSLKLECTIPLDNNFVAAGDECELSNASLVMGGVVTNLTSSKEGKLVTVAIGSDEASAGDTFDVEFERESDVSYTLIPNGALNQDNDGYFLYQVKRRDGILGKEFYLERLNVYIGDSDSEHTAVTEGITFFEPIMLLSDKAVSEGDVVALENAGDFFKD